MSRENRFAYAFGGSNSACNWLRLPKLCLPYIVLFSHSPTASTRQSLSAQSKLTHLFYVMGATTHIAACGWFYVGDQYAVLHPLIMVFPILGLD
jgi:hypothetical protein